MDDLLGEDWQKPVKPPTANKPPLNPSTFASSYTSSRASPALSQSGTASPLNISRPSSTLNGGAKSATSGDQFGSLLSLKAQKAATNNVSIQERQKQLLEEKRRQKEQQAAMWDNLGSGRGTPEIRGPSPAISLGAHEDEDDILAAFNRTAPVDNASHFPPPASEVISGRSTPAQQPFTATSAPSDGFDDDDDPFGLGSMPKQSNGHDSPRPAPQASDDDDILGDLGRPVSDRPKPASANPAREPLEESDDSMARVGEAGGEDRALAEIIEMGFPADNAKIALAESGGDVQAAVGWLLQQAHEESKQEARAETGERQRGPARSSGSPPRRPRGDQNSMPAWMREEARSNSGARRQDNRSPAQGDRDPAQLAQEYGNKLFKGATSLWKASQKQMAKTMVDFQQDRHPNQPKWMQDSSANNSRSNSQQRREGEQPRAAQTREVEVTDEAAMLDAPRERPQKPPRPTAHGHPVAQPGRDRNLAEPPIHRPAAPPKLEQQKALPQQDKRPAAKLSRQDVEDQSAQAYVSPARRKKTAPQPGPPPEPEVDLFSPAPPKPNATSTKPARVVASTRPAPVPSRPKAPLRSVPMISPASLSTSANHRKAGGEAFKRGDYASAHEFYTKALSPLPAAHPMTIVVYTNRALTGIKTGDAKSAVSDADQALSVIGGSQGVGESIELGGGEGTKEMHEFYGKALMRKAEALEHLEKWSDAAAVWRLAVEAGVGGAVSLKGKDRCERAAAPEPAPRTKPAAPARKAAAPPAKSLGNSLTRPSLATASSAEAVKKLRAANAAAERADDEKFALTDQVDARLTAWKGGKADNLRALLQSLEGVLWEGAGWKKVGMSDLVLPNKVKIIYMKAIAKVHPDKIPQDATTEQRMISGAVFSTLNEAWDKFKKDNNL